MHPFVNIALRAARKAGEIIERASENIDQLEVLSKSPSDFVTEVDQAAETEILYHLQKAYPDHAFICEESGVTGDPKTAEYHWVIDPLDGTTNFIQGISHYCVSIACLNQKGIVEHAVIYDPIKREEFTASRGQGAQVNGRRMRVREKYEKHTALFATGIPFGGQTPEEMQAFNITLEELSLGSAGVRRFGASALDLAYVATGRFDAYWEKGIKPWDIAAGILLVQEAGGLVSDFNGGFDQMKSGKIVAGSPKAFKATLKAVQAMV
ncbi:MAG: inositol monophosphatase [Sinobacterium sp.]|nr:inositol monophosphatase [Sinobacterium sp.]